MCSTLHGLHTASGLRSRGGILSKAVPVMFRPGCLQIQMIADPDVCLEGRAWALPDAHIRVWQVHGSVGQCDDVITSAHQVFLSFPTFLLFLSAHLENVRHPLFRPSVGDGRQNRASGSPKITGTEMSPNPRFLACEFPLSFTFSPHCKTQRVVEEK